MIKRSNKTLAYYLIAVWIIAAFLLESSDLWISINVYDPQSFWAVLLEKFGEIPGLVVVLLGVHIYIVTLKASSNIKTILLRVFFNFCIVNHDLYFYRTFFKHYGKLDIF